MTHDIASRRKFLGYSIALTGAGVIGPSLLQTAEAAKMKVQLALAIINGLLVTKWKTQLPNPLDSKARADLNNVNNYTMDIQESWQDYGIREAMIEPYLTQNGGQTKVWGYANIGATTGWATEPGPTFDLDIGTSITVTFRNQLVDAQGRFLPNPMPVDYSIDWANPGALGGFTPVPVTTHLHGGKTQYQSDGLPDSWATPANFLTTPIDPTKPWKSGRLYNQVYTYANDLPESAHLWYHDHALGVTRLNVHMGLAGLYFLRDQNEKNMQAANVIPAYPYEVPLIIHDRLFMNDGTLVFAAGAGSSVLPVNSMLPEFFGETITVNSKAWPVLDVEPRKYRFRILNASDSRFYELKLNPVAGATGTAPPILVIGNELGFLNKPVVAGGAYYPGGVTTGLAIAPGERYDVVIDFTGLQGKWFFSNTAKTPYYSGQIPATGLCDQVMAFNVNKPMTTTTPNASVNTATSLRPVGLPDLATLTASATKVRKIVIAEGKDVYSRILPMLGPVGPQAGYDLQGSPTGALYEGTLLYKDPITEVPTLNSTEIWEFYNTTPDVHPIHMHLVNFRVVNREVFSGRLMQKTNSDGTIGMILPAKNINLSGKIRPVYPSEAGRKDTVQCFPNEVTRIVVTFDKAGEYVYHCHILSHEDHEMMRRYTVV